MFEKEFILDSQTRLEYRGGKYWFINDGEMPVAVNEPALEMTRNWITEFAKKYPGYADKKWAQYDRFTR